MARSQNTETGILGNTEDKADAAERLVIIRCGIFFLSICEQKGAVNAAKSTRNVWLYECYECIWRDSVEMSEKQKTSKEYSFVWLYSHCRFFYCVTQLKTAGSSEEKTST